MRYLLSKLIWIISLTIINREVTPRGARKAWIRCPFSIRSLVSVNWHQIS